MISNLLTPVQYITRFKGSHAFTSINGLVFYIDCFWLAIRDSLGYGGYIQYPSFRREGPSLG